MASPRKIVIKNLNEKPFGLQIEPWAQFETIQPGSTAEIVFDNDLDRELEVTLTEDGGVFVGIADDITFTVDGRVVLDMRNLPASDQS